MIKQILEGLADLTESSEYVTPDIMMLKFTVVNAFAVKGRDRWILVDSGLENSYDFILEETERYGVPPSYILLTHGHFDHVGSVKKLASHWMAPVYAHEKEFPYLTGQKDYPKGKPDADEGLIAKMSAHFPNRAIDIDDRLRALPADGSLPEMTDWRWIATPGHTEGHVSLFREWDGVLIVGDAFTATKQESLTSVLTQKEEVKGPPAYFTKDWEAVGKSVRKLAGLKPSLALFSHGKPMEGDELTRNLEYLADNFEAAALPHSY